MAWKPLYVTAQELKDELLKIDQDVDDAWIGRAVVAASRAIDDTCRRQFGKTDALETRYYRAEWRPDKDRWVVVIDDLMTVAGLEVEVDGGAAVTGHRLMERNAAADGVPWERLEFAHGASVVPVYPDREVAVTATWGWSAVPPAVAAAAMLQASRFYSRRDSPYGIAGSPESPGSELRLLARVDPDVAVTLTGFVRIARPA